MEFTEHRITRCWVAQQRLLSIGLVVFEVVCLKHRHYRKKPIVSFSRVSTCPWCSILGTLLHVCVYRVLVSQLELWLQATVSPISRRQFCHTSGSWAHTGIMRWPTVRHGLRQLQAVHLKPKHINALVERWKAEELSAGAIKNRLACLRWLVEKIGKQKSWRVTMKLMEL